MRKALAISSARLCTALLKAFHLGNASSLPGRVALKVCPSLLQEANSELECQADSFRVMVSGTNGKTTSVGLMDSIYEVLRGRENLVSNRLGANLYYGVATAFCNFQGDLKNADYILEVDEAALKTVVKHVKPDILAFTNIFRDQLDRFGEIDATKNLLEEAVKEADKQEGFKLILNYDDIKLRSIETASRKNIYFFRLFADSVLEDKLIEEKLSDKDSFFFGADENNLKEENTNFITGKLKVLDARYSVFELSFRGESIEVQLNLPGIYNVYNALLASSVFLVKGVDLQSIAKGISTYRGAFGRSQTLFLNEVESNIYLIKNPKGCSEVLHMLKASSEALFLIVINDNYADGRDVSWLWDADFESLVKSTDTVMENENRGASTKINYICSGKRAYDMALRLRYAGANIAEIYVEENINLAVNFATDYIKNGSERNLNVLPTYTALLELEKMFNLTGATV